MSKAADKKAALKLIERYKRQLDIVRQSGTFNPLETAEQKNERIKDALADPVIFAETYFPHYCSAKSAAFHRRSALAVLRNKRCRRIHRWGRAHAKSVWADVIIPIWLWVRGEPMYLVIIGSSYDKAKTLLSDVQAEFEANPRILHDFGDQKMDGSWEDGHFVTKGGFVGHALGMGQSVRGLRYRSLRPSYIVLDDCETRQLCKNPKRLKEMVEWVTGDVLGTLDGPVQRVIMANNGFAPDMIQRRLEKEFRWEVDQVNAYDPVTYEPAWPEKYSAQYWRDLEQENGKLAVRAEYNNEPHTEGSIFTDDLFQYGKPPRLDHFEAIVGHWDVAYAGTATADFNAVRVWGIDKQQNYWLIGTFCKQSKMRAAIDWMLDFDSRLPESVIVHWQYESQFWNDELERTLADAEKGYGRQLLIRKADLPKAHKYDRILSMHAYYQNGRIFFSEKLIPLGDHQVALDQIKGIEPGYSTKDDAPDADERAISELSKYARVSNYSEPVFGKRRAPKNIW